MKGPLGWTWNLFQLSKKCIQLILNIDIEYIIYKKRNRGEGECEKLFIKLK